MNILKKKIILQSWQALKENLSLWILIMVFMLFFNLLISVIQDRLLEDLSIQGVLFVLASYLFQAGLNLGMIALAINIYRARPVGFSQIFSKFHLLFVYTVATIFSFIIIVCCGAPGLIMLWILSSSDIFFANSLGVFSGFSMAVLLVITIVPMIYVSIRLQLYHYYLVDTECSAINSIKYSFNSTEGIVYELFVLGAILSIIILISIIPLLLGLFISLPLAAMVNARVYEIIKIKEKKQPTTKEEVDW